MKTLRWFVGVLVFVVAVMVCAIVAYGAYQYGASRAYVAPPVVFQPASPAPVCPTVVPQVCPQAEATAPEFGPEMAFPAKVNGPAIAELWNPNNGFCALVKINSGENLDWKYSGAWWQARDQSTLDVRWPHHLAEYQAKPGSASCKTLTSANDVPQQ